MGDPEMHHFFADRFYKNTDMLRQIADLKASIRIPDQQSALSRSMKQVLATVDALPSDSHTNLREIVDLVAVELFFKRLDLTSEAAPPVC